MERPLKKHKINKEQSNDQLGFTSLPIEIIFKIFDEYHVADIHDLIRLSFSCSFFYNIFSQTTYWKDRYYKEYNQHDELTSTQSPKHRIKLFLWSFLPTDYETNNNGYDWCNSYKRRWIYDNTIQRALAACQFRERSGWKPMDPTDNNNYHKNLSKDTYRFGFRFDHDAIFELLSRVTSAHPDNLHAIYLQTLLNLPGIVDIKDALDLCFLHLTLDAFQADPSAILISVIDPFHFKKAYNPHIAHAAHLCSLPLPPITDRSYSLSDNDFNEEPVITPGENTEICEYGLRRWGFYTNCYDEGLLWGDQLNDLLENKYRSEYLFDPTVFKPCSYINNFKDLTQ